MNEDLKTSAPAASRSWKWVRELESEVGARWAAAGKSLDAFPGICRQCLAAAVIGTDRRAFLRRLLDMDYPGRQCYLNGEFGDVAITVARNEDFRIDVYLWNGGRDTAIHDHHFAGAYRPVFGESRQHSFVFEPGRDYGPELTGGVLRHRETRSVGRGEAVEIPVGGRLIHMVEHLGEPTVTICVRTGNLDGRDLNGYWFPGWRCGAGALLSPPTRKRLNLLFAMEASEQPDWSGLIRPFLQSLPAMELFLLVVEGHRLLPRASDAARGEFNGALRACVRQHPGWLLAPAVHHRRIERLLSPGTGPHHDMNQRVGPGRSASCAFSRIELPAANLIDVAVRLQDASWEYPGPDDYADSEICYAPPVGQELLLSCREAVAAHVGERVWPVCSFARRYRAGSALGTHSDRPGLVYTVSILLAGPPVWPIRCGGEVIEQRPGECVVMDGRINHSRPASGAPALVLLLHYSPSRSDFGDRRRPPAQPPSRKRRASSR